MDKITNRQYSDKLAVNVLCLKNLEDATEEERKSGLYRWAKFFAAATWEELKMAAGSEAMQEAVGTMQRLSEDESIRRQCQEREDFELDQRTMRNSMKRAIEKEQKLRKKAEEGQKREQELRKKEEAQRRALLEWIKENTAMTEEEILSRIR